MSTFILKSKSGFVLLSLCVRARYCCFYKSKFRLFTKDNWIIWRERERERREEQENESEGDILHIAWITHSVHRRFNSGEAFLEVMEATVSSEAFGDPRRLCSLGHSIPHRQRRPSEPHHPRLLWIPQTHVQGLLSPILHFLSPFGSPLILILKLTILITQ